MDDFDALVTSLRRQTKNHDPHVRAAVELLIWEGSWIRRPDFQAAAIGRDAVKAWIMWGEAARFRAGPGASASSSELAVLDVAIEIGLDAFRLSRMDDEQAEAVVTAFAAALGMEKMLRA